MRVWAKTRGLRASRLICQSYENVLIPNAADLIEEANLAFSLNTDLFSIIRVPAKGSKKAESGTVATENRPQTRAEFLTQSAWFLAAALFGVFLNIYVGPLLSKLFA